MATIEELEIAAEHLPVAIWMGRVPSGEVVYTNAAFREVLGLDGPPDALRGGYAEPYGVHLPDGTAYPEDAMPFELVLRARATVVVDDMVVHRRDGRKVRLRVFAKPLFDVDGNITHVLEAFTDSSREFEAQEAKAESERRLARAQRLESIGQLVAGIAHDFNNLLTVTKLVISRLRQAEENDAKRSALSDVDTVTDSAIALIQNLVRFASRKRSVLTTMSLDEVAASVVALTRRTFEPRVTLSTELEAGGGWVTGDISQIEQVLMNLLVNARDAVDGNGHVIVRTTRRSLRPNEIEGCAAGSYVVLEVSDDGTGIAPAIRERIFEPYFTTKNFGPVKGTGLGLSTVHGIVHAHSGMVEVAENAPRGTVMRAFFPEVDAEDRSLREKKAPPESAKRLASATLLLVDDEPLVRDATRASLSALGYQVIEAESGAQALAACDANPRIGAVVLDMVMPGMSAELVYTALKQKRPGIPVLLITGCAMNDEVRALLDLGISAWLPKPFDDEQLADALRSIGAGA